MSEKSRADDALLIALLLLAWLGLLGASQQWVFLVPILAAIVAYPLLEERVSFDIGLMGYLILSLPLALLTQVHEIQGLGGNRYNLSFYAGVYCLLVGAVKLYAPAHPTRVPRVLLASALALAAAGAGLPSYLDARMAWYFGENRTPGAMPGAHRVFIGMCVVYGVLAVIVLRRTTAAVTGRAGPRRRALFVAVGASLLTAAALTVGACWAIRVNYYKASQLFIKLASGIQLRSGRGFSDQAMLDSVSSVRADEGREIALEAFSRTSPGYLRGKVFMRYIRSRWVVARPGPGGTFQVVEGRVDLPGRPPPPAEAEPALEVHPASEYNAVYFLPLHATAVDTISEEVQVYPGNVMRSIRRPTSRGYGVHTDPGPVLQDGERKDYLVKTEDPELRAALRELLDQLHLKSAAPEEAVGKLARYFTRHYTYEFGIQFHDRSDPLVQFLREKRHGHCELFASVGVLALRELGIPARYVTGFVCDEKSPVEDGMWIARNRYAHAWAEFFTPRAGWQLAELTPAAGVPHPKPASGIEAWLDWLRSVWDRVLAAVRRGPSAILELIKQLGLWLIGAWYRVGVLFLIVIAYLLRGRLRRGERTIEVAVERSFPAALAAERERFLALEERLGRAGLARHPWETVLEYADRLEGEELPEGVDPAETLAFLRGFALARYGPEAVAPP